MKSAAGLYRDFFKGILVLILLFASYTNSYGQEDRLDAIITLSFFEEDDVKTIQAKAIDQEGLPIADLELYFYVQRTFSLLPIGDFFNMTDEDGIVEIAFPEDLPGDSEGYVKIVVKLLDSDMYNDQTVEMIKDWGIPTQIDQFEEKRTLWSAGANAPLTLVFGTCGMILVIWYIIGHNIFILFKISKVKETNS